MAWKTFEASTEKVLHFVESIQDVFSDNSAPLSNLSERRVLLGSQMSLMPLGKNGHNIPATLALESKELVKSVRAILDMDCKFSIRFHSFKNQLFRKTKEENFTFGCLLL